MCKMRGSAEPGTNAGRFNSAPCGRYIPHPDGIQRIKNASEELTKACDEMMEASRLLDNYISGDEPSRKD